MKCSLRFIYRLLPGMVFVLVSFLMVLFAEGRDSANPKKPARTYYIDSRNGSDEKEGSKSEPWKSLAKIDRFPFSPGDSVCFARGSRFDGGFTVSRSGDAGMPITFCSYGEGPKPIFTQPNYNNMNGNAIRITGCHIIIDGLYFYNCPKSPVCAEISTLGAVYLAVGADHNVVKNCEMTKTPVGIQVYGQHNVITHNYIHDNNVSIKPQWGPMCVIVCTSNNEICYNRFENYAAPSNEYGHDGGAIEINDRKYPKENIIIHHNYSYKNQGFIEFVGLVKQDHMVIHHNVCEDYQSFIGFTGPCTNIRVENNTVIRVLSHGAPDSEDVTFWFYYDNSDLIFRNNIFVYDPSRIEAVFSRGKFSHDHNLFYRLDDPQPMDSANYSAYQRLVLGGGDHLGKGDLIGNPMFIDFKNRNYRLHKTSPAIDRGVDLGYKLDFDNKPIPSGGAVDMGAYEYQGGEE